MNTNINQNDKRIITNEELYTLIVSSISDLRKSTLDGFDRVFEVIDENKIELKQDISNLRTELKGDINSLRIEIKTDISDLKKEMNQRFLTIDNRFLIIDGRLCGIEENMIYKHHIFPKFV